MSNGGSAQTLETPPERVALAWAIVALWAGLIWWLGTASFDAPTTSRFIEPFVRWLWPDASLADRLAMTMAIRKLAHPAVYGVLAGFALRATLVSGVSGWVHGTALALGVAVGTAALDELRQFHTPARTGSPTDVLLDAVGATGALCIAAAARRLVRTATNRSAP